MSSPPAPSPAQSSHLHGPSPKAIRTGPTFAHDNDQSSMISNNGDVEADIDELLSEEEEVRDTKECKWGTCPDVFDTTEALVQHLHTDHIPIAKESLPKDSSWTCEWSGCPRKGQAQTNRHSLITHCRTHTGERPYTCKHKDCTKTFVRSDAMNKHFRTVHGPNGDKPPPVKKERPPKKEKVKPTDEKPNTTTTTAAAAAALSREPIASSSKPGHVIEPHTGRVIPTNPSYPIDWTEVLDAGLYEDSDLSEAVHTIQKNEGFWDITEFDLAVVNDYRKRHPRPINDEEDDFDEGVNDAFPNEPAIMDIVPDPDSLDTELRVLSRPRWQVRYMLAKAKLMLVEEENRMRRFQLWEMMKAESETGPGTRVKQNGEAAEEGGILPPPAI